MKTNITLDELATQFAELVIKKVDELQAPETTLKRPFKIFVGAHSDWIVDASGREITRPGHHQMKELEWMLAALNSFGSKIEKPQPSDRG